MKRFLKALLTAIAMLCVPIWAASATKLVQEGMSFANPADSIVSLCDDGAAHCGAGLAIPASLQNVNCGIGFARPVVVAGTALFCYVDVQTPPVVTTPQPFTSCYPDIDVKLTWAGWVSTNYHYGDVPASVGARKPYVGWWIDCNTKLYVGQYFDWDDITKLAAAAAKQLLGSSNAINAYVATQPIEYLNQAEFDYEKQLLATLNLQVALPPVKPPCVVAAIAAGTRPYGTVNSTNTGITKKGDIAVGVACDKTVRLGMTSYYGVAGQKNVLGQTIAAGNFALGTVQ